MKTKPLLLRYKINSNTNILIRNPLEFETFINSASLSKAQVATITASLYNPNYTQNAIFANMAKFAMHSVHKISSNSLHWSAKTDPI